MKMIETAKVISIFRLLMMNHPQATAVMKNIQALVDDDAVDAEPVVRCKDCKYWEHGDCYRLELSRPEDFCSYGERKADNAVD